MTASRDHKGLPIIRAWKLGSEETMLGLVPNLPTRIVTKGLNCLRPVCLALVAVLVLFAGSASADVTGSLADPATEDTSAMSPEAAPITPVAEAQAPSQA